MSDLVRRKCSSEKECNGCEIEIQIGEFYYTSPNKSFCEKCNLLDKERIKKEKEQEKIILEKKVENDNYPITGNCEYCENKALGIMNEKKVCANQEHIDMALGIIKSET